MQLLDDTPPAVLAWTRGSGRAAVLVAINMAARLALSGGGAVTLAASRAAMVADGRVALPRFASRVGRAEPAARR